MTPSLPPGAGEIGAPVDAVCIGCSAEGIDREATKRVPLETLGVDALDDLETATFRHVCHRCQTVTHWNVTAPRPDLFDEVRGEQR